MHASVAANCKRLKMAITGGETIDVHGPVAALGGEEFVHWVPGHALDIMGMLSDFPYQRPIRRIEDTGDIIGAAGNYEVAQGAPR